MTSDTLERVWADPPGLLGRLRAVQNDTLGKRILILSFVFFLLGGIDVFLIRIQLARPENSFLSPETYNELFTMHGSVTMYLFAVPMLEGFTILILPILLGNREMPFPRLTVFSFFTFLFGGMLFYTSTLAGAVPAAGWFAYMPLSGPEYSPGLGMDYWLLALGVAEIGAIAAGVEIIITILKMRAPGMTISRMPIFAWAMLVTAFMILFAFTTLLVASLLLELDRKAGTQFFNAEAGGSPVLWQHLFWIFGHPEVYIQFIPAAGMVSMMIPVFSRRPLNGYPFVATAMVATGFLSFGLWVHHMFTIGLPQIAMSFFAAAGMMIAIPSGVQIFAWISTIWAGRPVWKTPFLFLIGFLILFVLGGITGVMTAAVPFDLQVHDSAFVTAHFHYVLIGGVVFPIFAGLYYWLPKWTGKLLDERLGRWNFWLMFVGLNLAFFPLHIVGLLGMPRRVYTYAAGLGWDIYNLLSTIGAGILGLGILTFVLNFFYSLRNGRVAGNNPWGGDSLEWSTTSPPPNYGFAVSPIVHSRHPLWEQPHLLNSRGSRLLTAPGDPSAPHAQRAPGGRVAGQIWSEERTEKLAQALARWPLTWRAALITTTLDAQPEEVFRVSGPSLWPLVTSFGVMLIFIGELFNQHLTAALGGLLALVSIIGWNWPEKAPIPVEEEAAFEMEHGIPVNTTGSPAVARLAMGLTTLIVGIVGAALLFSYFYIRLENVVWPPENIAQPDFRLALISAALLLVSAGAMYWSLGSIQAGERSRLQIGLAVTFLLGTLGLGIQIFDFTRLGFDWRSSAYGSLFYVIGGYAFLLVLVGLGMNLLTQIWAWQGHYSARRHIPVENTARYWYAMIAAWMMVFAILYLSPRLI